MDFDLVGAVMLLVLLVFILGVWLWLVDDRVRKFEKAVAVAGGSVKRAEVGGGKERL